MKIYYYKIYIVLFLVIIGSIDSLSQPQIWNLFDSPEYFGKVNNPKSNSVNASIIDYSGIIYLALDGSGIAKSTDNGTSWELKNNGLVCLTIKSIVITKAGTLFAATFGEGIYKSTNKGETWVEVNSGLKHKYVKALTVYSNNTIIAGTYGGGIYFSNNDGADWKESNQGLYFRDITSLNIADNGYILAGTYGGGIYSSRDTLKTWVQQNAGLTNLYINTLYKDRIGAIYAATNGRGVFESGNNGISWTPLDTFMTRPWAGDISPLPDLNATSITTNKNNKIVFGTRFGGVFYFDDVEDFTFVPSNVRGYGINNLLTENNKNNKWVFANDLKPQLSTDNGQIWTEKPAILEVERPKVFNFDSNNYLMYYTNGDVKTSFDNGYSWINAAKMKSNINAVAIDSNGFLLMATDSGLFNSLDKGVTWSLFAFKDTCVFDVECSPSGNIWVTAAYIEMGGDPPVVIFERTFVFVTSDFGQLWRDATMMIDRSKEEPRKITIDANNIIYISVGGKLFYSYDNGYLWQPTTPIGDPSETIREVFVDKNNWIYISKVSDLWISKTTNVFEKVNLFSNYTNLTYVDQNGHIYATSTYPFPNEFGYFEILYKSTDGGSSFKILNNSYNSDVITNLTSNTEGDLVVSTVSGTILKNVNSSKMQIPELVELKNKANDITNYPILNWKTIKKADLYQLQISTDLDFVYNFESATVADTFFIVQKEFLPNTKYYWRVRSKYYSALSEWSEIREFNTKIDHPILYKPDNASKGVNIRPNLIWFSVDSASKYEILISKNNNFSDTIYHIIDVYDTTYSIQPLESTTKYYWKVRASNDISISEWSDVWSFTTILGPPKLIQPSHEKIGLASAVEFVWLRNIYADSYRIQISDIEDFTNIIIDSVIKDTSINIPNFAYNKYYWWRVSSIDNVGESDFSSIWKFRTGYSPIILISPKNNSTNHRLSLDFNWFRQENNDTYQFQLSKDANFTTLVEEINTIADTTINISSLDYNTIYFWRVRKISSENNGVWSDVFQFKTFLNKVVLRSPSNKSKDVPYNLNFLWYAVQNATKYHLQISRNDKFQDLYYSQDTITNNNLMLYNLPENIDLYWRVRAMNSDGDGEWSDTWSFNCNGNSPMLILPNNGDTVKSMPINFVWGSFEESIHFQLQIAEDPMFNNLVLDKNEINGNSYSFDQNTLKKNTEYYWRVRANLLNTNQSDWSQSWTFRTGETVGIINYEISRNINIEPNPANTYFDINFDLNDNSNCTLEILDMSGRKVHYQYLGHFNQGNIKLHFGAEGFINGIYFIRVITKGVIYESPLIINK